jgi:hypothetical protein
MGYILILVYVCNYVLLIVRVESASFQAIEKFGTNYYTCMYFLQRGVRTLGFRLFKLCDNEKSSRVDDCTKIEPKVKA